MINTNIAKFLLILLILLLTGSCKKAEVKDKPLITTTIYPYELIVKQIVKDKARVQSIIPVNTSPHTYSPLPADIKLLYESDLVFSNGLDLEVQFEKILAELKNKHTDVTNFIPKAIIEFEHENQLHSDNNHDEEDSHHHGAINPHIWLHPENVIDIAKGINSQLCKLMPENEDFFNQNLTELVNDVMSVDRKIISERENMESVNLISFHDSFHYYNLRYNIKSFGFIQKFPGKEPTALELENIGRIIKKNNIHLLVTEPQLNPKPVKILADEFNLKVIELDPLGQKLQVNKISDLLDQNWKNIADGLK